MPLYQSIVVIYYVFMSTTSVGREAESMVASYLCKKGYKLLDQNWRNRFCEIDLVMSKAEVVYFIEVKYRSSTLYGDGLEYITPKKLKQMRFASEFWMSSRDWRGDASLVVAGVDQDMAVQLVELI
jgi:putative endonuclease